MPSIQLKTAAYSVKDVRWLLINKAGAEMNLPRLLYMIGNSSPIRSARSSLPGSYERKSGNGA